MAGSLARCTAGVAVGVAVLISCWMLAFHAMGVIETPYLDAMGGRCLPEAVGMADLCSGVGTRAVAVQLAPEQIESDVVEVTGPVSVVVTLFNPTAAQRVVYQAPAIIGWTVALVFEGTVAAMLLGRLRGLRLARAGAGLGVVSVVAGLIALLVLRLRGDVLLRGADPLLRPESPQLAGPLLLLAAGGLLLLACTAVLGTADLREDVKGLV